MEIIPAILEQSFEEIEKKLSRAEHVTRTIQLDVCDGIFVKNITWPYITSPEQGKSFNYDAVFTALLKEERDMPGWESFDFELDLMVADPLRLLPDLLVVGPSRIVFHLSDPKTILDTLHVLRSKIPGLVSMGIAIPAGGDISFLKECVAEGVISFVQVMGIEKIGFQGQPFDTRALATIQTIRQTYPELPISVDGAVSMDTKEALRNAGATDLVVGSAFWKTDDLAATLKKLGA